MERQQRQRTGGGGRRRRRKTKKESQPKAEPVFIAARRPDAPRVLKVSNQNIAASAAPKVSRQKLKVDAADSQVGGKLEEKPRRAARIVRASVPDLDEDELRRQRLLERLLASEGRLAISRAADALEENGTEVPEEQGPQLQLLEHVDESRARRAISVMARLLDGQEPLKRPILDQRLRRLEDEAEELETREQAAELRRVIRVA